RRRRSARCRANIRSMDWQRRWPRVFPSATRTCRNSCSRSTRSGRFSPISIRSRNVDRGQIGGSATRPSIRKAKPTDPCIASTSLGVPGGPGIGPEPIEIDLAQGAAPRRHLALALHHEPVEARPVLGAQLAQVEGGAGIPQLLAVAAAAMLLIELLAGL